jgi:glycine/D-amino acid oxidase-like deaminating enzyme
MHHPLHDPPELPFTAFSAAAGEPPEAPPLEGAHAADLCVIGGGYTGLSAALHAAAAGARVVLLEANEIGWGASGRNFGQVVPYLKHEPAQALSRLGATWGGRMVEAACGGPDLVFGLIDKHGMACEARRAGLLFAAHTPAALKRLEARAAFWRDRGDPIALLDPGAARAAIGGGRYWGAALERRGGTLNALGYARGLARAAQAAGARLCVRSRATALKRDGARWRIETAAATVSAANVAIATNAYTDGLWPGLSRTIVPVRAYQLFTRPLPENLRRSILPGGQALTDTRRMISGVRLHADGSLHLSGYGPPFGPEARPDRDDAARRLRALFPQIGEIAWAGHWSGWIAMTVGEFPKLIEPAPGILAGLGYSGRGIALATVMGRELARRAGGALADSLAFRIEPPRSIPSASAARVVARGIVALYRLRDAVDALRYGNGPAGAS